MTNTPHHDLDQSNREEQIYEVLEDLDGASIFNMISIVADACDIDLVRVLEELVNAGYKGAVLGEQEMMIADMINFSQSNPDRAFRALRDAAKIAFADL